MTPAADHAALRVLVEPVTPEALLELVEAASRSDVDDYVDILRRPRCRRGRIGHPQPHRRTADEYDLVEQRAERRCRDFQELNAHASRARNSSVARLRARASPTRTASTKDNISYIHGSDRATPVAA